MKSNGHKDRKNGNGRRDGRTKPHRETPEGQLLDIELLRKRVDALERVQQESPYIAIRELQERATFLEKSLAEVTSAQTGSAQGDVLWERVDALELKTSPDPWPDVNTLQGRVDALWANVDRIGVPDGDSTLIDAIAELQQDARTAREHGAALQGSVERHEAAIRGYHERLTHFGKRIEASERIAKALVKTNSGHADALHVLLNASGIEVKSFPSGGEGQDLSPGREVETSSLEGEGDELPAAPDKAS
jgi:hypothetical protein